jgi:hypothetical protein
LGAVQDCAHKARTVITQCSIIKDGQYWIAEVCEVDAKTNKEVWMSDSQIGRI